MRPSFEELKSIWVYGYSKSALSEASLYVDEMETVETDSTRLHALVSAAVVAYARPFTKSQITAKKSVVPLQGVLPPSHLEHAHYRLLNARNKVIGHKDAMAIHGERARNVLIIKRGDNGATFYPTGLHNIEDWGRQEIKELCSYFITHCNTKLRPLMERYQADILGRPPGTYELVLCEPPEDWIRPYDDAWMIPLKP